MCIFSKKTLPKNEIKEKASAGAQVNLGISICLLCCNCIRKRTDGGIYIPRLFFVNELCQQLKHVTLQSCTGWESLIGKIISYLQVLLFWGDVHISTHPFWYWATGGASLSCKWQILRSQGHSTYGITTSVSTWVFGRENFEMFDPAPACLNPGLGTLYVCLWYAWVHFLAPKPIAMS